MKDWGGLMLTPHWDLGLGSIRGCGLSAQLTETCVTLLITKFLYCPKSWDWDTASQAGKSLSSVLGTLLLLAHALSHSNLRCLECGNPWSAPVTFLSQSNRGAGSAAGICGLLLSLGPALWCTFTKQWAPSSLPSPSSFLTQPYTVYPAPQNLRA